MHELYEDLRKAAKNWPLLELIVTEIKRSNYGAIVSNNILGT